MVTVCNVLLEGVLRAMSIRLHNFFSSLHDFGNTQLQYEGSESFEDLFNYFLVMNYEGAYADNVYVLCLL